MKTFKQVRENFMDGRNPQDKGDMARHGLKGKSITQLKKIRSSDTASKRQKQLAHWKINMTQGRNKMDEELDEGIKQAIAATVLATAAAASPHAHAQEPVQHPGNPHLVAHVEHEGKVHRFDLEKMFKSHDHARKHMTSALKKHGMGGATMHISVKDQEHKSPGYSVKHSAYMEKEPYSHKGSSTDYSDNKPYSPKHSDKDYFPPAN